MCDHFLPILQAVTARQQAEAQLQEADSTMVAQQTAMGELEVRGSFCLCVWFV